MIVLLVATLGQGLIFQRQYQASAGSWRRLHLFDADYPSKILPTALTNAAAAPVYLADNPARPASIQAYWYATLQGIPLSKFVSLGFDKSAPEGAVVITTESTCPRCRVLAESEPYTTYIAQGAPRELTRLPDEGWRAEISVPNPPSQLRRGEPTTIPVKVKNSSSLSWQARERGGSPFQIYAGNHWLDPTGRDLINDDGRGALPQDVRPGETVTIPLTINAPHRAGSYILEIDLLQEGVSWFALKGSRSLRIALSVK